MTDKFEQKDEDQDQELYEHYRFEADKGQGLLRIDKFLMARMENVSRNKIQQAAEAGYIVVNGESVKSSYKVKPNDSVSVMMAQPVREIKLIAEDIPLNILYEDDDVIIIDKSPGMVVHPAYGNYTGTLVNALMYHFQNTGNADLFENGPYLVHRIDKDTSGVMMVAKNEIAQMKIGNQFFKHTLDRKYHALVWGDVKEDSGTIEGRIGRSAKNRKVFTVLSDEEEYGKHAITHYKVIERFGYVTLVECELETGRTHQIRVHLKHLGHTLFNDANYGGDQVLKGTTFSKYKQFVENCFKICPRQALHAKSLGFIHPTTNEKMLFTSDLPSDMQELIEKWSNYSKHKILD
ncbi:MAG: RluA family pseudouridine synthase [Bacteroidales bacterium]